MGGTLTALLVALTQIVVTGLPVALLLHRRSAPTRGGLLGLSFLLGAGVVSMILLFLSMAGVPWARVTVTVAVLVMAVVLWVAAAKFAAFGATPSGYTWLDLPTLALLGMHAFLVARQSVGEWDFWAIWGLKGRVFYEHGAIDWAFLSDPVHAYQHPDYPPLLPLQYVFTAVHGGGWSDRWLGLITTFFAVAVTLVVREALGRALPRWVAALGTLAVAGVAATHWVGMAEAPMIAFGGAGLLSVREGKLPLGAVLLGLAACAKNEGLALIVAAGLALVCMGRVRDAFRLWPAALVVAPWLALRALHRLPGDFLMRSFDLERVRLVLDTIVHKPPERPLLWVGLAEVFVVFAGSLRRESFLLLATLFQVLFYVGAYLVTRYDVAWHIVYSWPRLLDQVAVPLVFVAAVMAGQAMVRNVPADVSPAPPVK
ncbi:MAG: hypothetical protein ABI779_10220 [Acidobacteriota bacterium]